jgi:hypothetical protein
MPPRGGRSLALYRAVAANQVGILTDRTTRMNTIYVGRFGLS